MWKIFAFALVVQTLCAAQVQVDNAPTCSDRVLEYACKMYSLPANFERSTQLERKQGTSIYQVLAKARSIGFDARAYWSDLSDFEENRINIVLINENHYAIVEGIFAKNFVILVNPPECPSVVPIKEFKKIWNGAVLKLSFDNKKRSRPAFALISSNIDLGTLQIHEGKKASFRLANISSTPQRIEKLATSCGCVTIEGTPGIVQAGEEINFVINFRGRDEEGDINEAVSVKTSDLVYPYLGASLKGRVVDKGRIFYPSFLNFGEMREGDESEKSVHFKLNNSKYKERKVSVERYTKLPVNVSVRLLGNDTVIAKIVVLKSVGGNPSISDSYERGKVSVIERSVDGKSITKSFDYCAFIK